MGWQDAPEVTAKSRNAWEDAPEIPAPSKPEAKELSLGSGADILKGVARGVADLGDTLINAGAAPVGAVIPAVKQWNDERKASLADFDAENDNTVAFKGGRVGGNVLATAPVGGLLGAGVKAASAAPVAQALGNAIASGGLRTGAQMGGLASAGVRAAGGAANGGASTALVSPDQAGEGALIGAATPMVLRTLGRAGEGLTKAVAGPAAPPGLLRAAESGKAAGYVVPPSSVSPTLANRLVEGLSGKAATAQNASTRNQEISNLLARKAVGLADDAELTPAALEKLRADAGQAYRDVASLPVKPAQAGSSLSNIPKSAEINPASMVEELKQARADSKAYFKAYNISANPEQLALARQLRGKATGLETALEKQAKEAGRDELVDALRAARKQIAKTYTVERALNPSTGNVDAQVLAKLLKKGTPLSDGLDEIGSFSAAFPKATQMPEKMASLPQVSPLDYAAALMSGNPAMLMARPAARALALSKPVQNRLTAPSKPSRPALNDEQRQRISDLLVRGAPVAVSAQ